MAVPPDDALRRVLRELEGAVEAWVAGATVRAIGSAALGLPLEPSDDVDVVVLVPARERQTAAVRGFPESLEAVLRLEHGWREVVAIAHARVPIVRATSPLERRVVDAQLLVLPEGDAWRPSDPYPPDDWTALSFGEGDDAGLLEAAPAVCALRMPQLLLRADYSPMQFLTALVRLRTWARSRRVYGAAHGFPPGVAWAIVLASVMRHGDGNADADPVLRVLRFVANAPWGGAAVRIGAGANARLPPWLPPALPDVQQPMAVLTPEFEQNTTTAVTSVHLEVLVDECLHALARAAEDRPWLDVPPRPWFQGVVVVSMRPGASAAQRLAVQARMPLVALQLASGGLSVRPLGCGRSVRCQSWLFGVDARSPASRVALRVDQLRVLLGRCAAFLRHKLAVDPQVGAGRLADVLPVFEVFAPKARWPLVVAEELRDAECGEQRRGLAATRKEKRTRTDAVEQQGRFPPPPFGRSV